MPQLTLDQAMQLAVQSHRERKLTDAEAIYRAILQQAPDHPQVMQFLGFVLADMGRDAEAADVFARLVERQPGFAEGWDNLATAMVRTKRYEEAELAGRRAIELDPSLAEAHVHLANALTESGRADEALQHLRRAIELRPDADDAYYNLGVALQELRRLPDAITEYERAIELNPDFAEARAKLGMALLMTGDFARGWEEYEWRMRWTSPDAGNELRWDGRGVEGQTVVLRGEQGLGDVIQMVRYAPLVRERGARVVVACQPALHRLASSVQGVSEVISPESSEKSPSLWTPIMSLPRVLGTMDANVPSHVPYVRADASRAVEFASKLTATARPLVGFAWSGNPVHRDDRRRSIDPRLLAPLVSAGVTFVSLQKDRPAGEVPFPIIDLTSELRDFADTAALVANLDLVVSVDTAVVHLAGAMGKPVWTMLAFVPDWRWMLEREDTPWYPTMRLFRQRERGEWSEVIERVGTELKSLGGGR